MSIGGIDSSVTEIDGVPVVERGSNTALENDDFLQLLVTQLQYQDPMNPLDNAQMVEQQAALAQLEQIEQLSTAFKTFIESQEDMMTQLSTVFATQQSIGFLGKQVDYPSETIHITDGEVSNMYYGLTEDAQVGYTINNAAGNAVRTVDPVYVEKGSRIPVEFDGKDQFGQTLPDGTYTIDFNVLSLGGEQMNGLGFSSEKVTSVDFRDGIPVLKLANGEAVSLGLVMSVNEEVENT